MKKKLSFLLALVFILTLAVGALPVAGASQSLSYDETLVIKKVIDPASDSFDANQKFEIKVTFTDDDNGGAPITKETGMSTMTYDGPGTLDQDGNSYKITLSQATGLVATISNLRQHISWTVEEQPLPTGWQAPTYKDEANSGHDVANDGKGQFIAPKMTDEVIITNKFVEPPHGSLTITKIVDPSDAPAATFPMTIKFSPYNNLDRLTAKLNGSLTTVTSTSNDGEYAFSLAADDIIIFDNIPTGVAYEVKETLTPYLIAMGWQEPTYEDEEVNGSGDIKDDGKGKIVNDGTTDSIEVHNTYVPPKTGTLTITKEIDAEYSDPFDVDQSPLFTIRVKFIGDYLDGIDDTDDRIEKKGTGIYDVSLKINEKVSFTNIPVGTSYVVEETTFPSTEWTLSSIDNDDYADPYYTIDDLKEEEIDVVTVKNVYKKPLVSDSLIITKSTTGYQGSPVMFNIRVTFTPHENYDTMSIQSIDLNHFTNTAGAVGEDGVYMLQIAGGSSVTFSGIPDNVSYLVEEVSVPSNWTFMEASSTGLSGDIYADNETTPHAIVVNNYTPPFNNIPVDNIVYGTLTVDKTAVSASTTAAIGTEPFSFTVTFTNPTSILGITNSLGLTGNNGVYTFTLTADAPAVVFSNIPTGTQYTVTEAISDAQTAAGWTQGTVTGDTGSITAAGATAVFENILTVVAGDSDNGSGNEDGSNDDEGQQVAGDSDSTLPQTGGIAFSTLFGIFGLVLIAIGGTAFTVLRKRFLGKSK